MEADILLNTFGIIILKMEYFTKVVTLYFDPLSHLKRSQGKFHLEINIYTFGTLHGLASSKKSCNIVRVFEAENLFVGFVSFFQNAL